MPSLTVGSVYPTNHYGELIVLEDNGCNAVVCKFITTGSVGTFRRGNVVRGNVKDLYLPSVYGRGFVGKGRHVPKISGKLTKSYACWCNMLNRCYGEEDTAEHYKTYRGSVHVCDSWLNYQVFGEWFDKNYIEGFDLDKDFLSGEDVNYSPETCIFIPTKLNTVLISCKSVRGDLPRGVTKVSGSSTFMARVYQPDGTRKYLGCFATPVIAFHEYRREKLRVISELAEEYKGLVSRQIYEKVLAYEIVDDSPWKAHLHKQEN